MLYSMKIFPTYWLWKLYYLAYTLSRPTSKKYCCSEIMFSTTQKKIDRFFFFGNSIPDLWNYNCKSWELKLKDWGYEDQVSSHLRCNVSFEDLNLQFFFFRKKIKGRNIFFMDLTFLSFSILTYTLLHLPRVIQKEL